MRIDGPDRPVRPAPARPRASVRGFALPEGDADPPQACCEPTATQAVVLRADLPGEDRPVADREARRHGQAILDALSGLQLAQLGGDPRASLAGLARLAHDTPSTSDPGLQDVLHAIGARAAVELARVT